MKSTRSRSAARRLWLAPALALSLVALGPAPAGPRLAAAPAPLKSPPALAGDAPLERFPESASLRMRYWDGFFSAPRDIALSRAPVTIDSGAERFRILSLRGPSSFYLVIATVRSGSDRDASAGSGAKGGPAKAELPLYTQGTWILKRSSADGRPQQAKVFLRSDPGCFIRIYPAGERSRMDLVLYGAVLNQEIPIPVPFDRAFRSPLSAIVAWTKDAVDWSLFSPRPGLYEEVRRLNDSIRARLPALAYAEDGALDPEGRAVLIRTGEPQRAPVGLNCSGFAKWVIDGYYRPLAGRLLDPREMAKRHVDLRGSPLVRAYEESLDPFFGLDWTRNLGLALAEAREPERGRGLLDADARVESFALVSAPEELVDGPPAYDPYPAYDESRGYAAPGLKAVLYLLASREPGRFYLASISRSGGGEIYGLKRHYHVAVLVPYFGEGGNFEVAVFESAAETGLEALMGRLRGDFVHLVGVEAHGEFDPAVLR